jgi:ketosteroid isomerase-like protein
MSNDDHCILRCSQLVTGSYALMDLGDYDGCAALFCEDATWVRGGMPVTGRDAIRAALDLRPVDLISRHLITNIFVTPQGDTASATAVFVPVRAMLQADDAYKLAPFGGIGDLRYSFRVETGNWKISRLEPTIIIL